MKKMNVFVSSLGFWWKDLLLSFFNTVHSILVLVKESKVRF